MGKGTAFAAAALAGTVFLWASAPAAASAYSDFNTGVALTAREPALAVKYLSSALADPGLLPSLRPAALLDRAVCYERARQFDLALADYAASAALRPGFDAFQRRGLLLYRLGRIEEALGDIAAAGAVRPDLPDGHALRLSIYLKQKRFDEAIAEQTALIDLAPKEAEGYVKRSNLHLLKGDFDAAVADADRAIAIHEFERDANLAKIAAYRAQDRLPEALDAIEHGLKPSSEDSEMLLAKGFVLWQLGRSQDAADAFALVLQREPGHPYALLWTAIVHGAGAPAANADAAPEDLPAGQRARNWPEIVLELYDGYFDPKAVLAAAGVPDGEQARRVCEADFYLAQWHLQHARRDDAKASLLLAARDCSVEMAERAAALRQLKDFP